MDIAKHPIFKPNGFQIPTKPTETFANFILQNVENDFHGCSAYGGGGLGKTSAQQFLTDHCAHWLVDEDEQPIGVASRLIMPSGLRRSDSAFYTALTNSLKISNTDRLSAKRGKERLVNFVKTRCGQAKQTLMVMFIDCAQRITRAEFDYLADVDEQLTDVQLRLFLVFVRQSDATGVEVSDDWSDYPSHMVRRWFMATHAFQPLKGVAEIMHALSRYDSAACWPDPDMPYTRYFARRAFDNGWRLEHQAQLLLDGINALRACANMGSTDTWPMQTFTQAVRYLLANIAGRNAQFEGFTPQQVREALEATGYLRLEYVRANLVLPREAA